MFVLLQFFLFSNKTITAADAFTHDKTTIAVANFFGTQMLTYFFIFKTGLLIQVQNPGSGVIDDPL